MTKYALVLRLFTSAALAEDSSPKLGNFIVMRKL
jgi:hypothetical protein